MKAIADTKALIPRYKSGSEQQFSLLGAAILREAFDAAVVAMFYEPVRWKIPGGQYTPDWLCLMETGMVVFVEVKGSKKQKGYRDARSKLRAVQAMYPFFTFVEVVEENGWQVEVIS